jgi:hypothetical protein
MATNTIIPLFSSRGEVEGYLIYPHLFNRQGEWIGWVTPQREVYSVLGYYVGDLASDRRIVRKRAMDEDKPRLAPPKPPARLRVPPTIPLSPMMADLPHSLVDVFEEEPHLLHTLDSGELRQDLD